jgi:hypothetical protein
MEKLDDGISLDVIFLDFAKVFDSVPHQRLLNKLRAFGISDQIVDWRTNYLSGRKQRVTVNGEESSTGDVLSGVPQGSVLGPLVFVMFINDMPDVVHNHIALFADDAKLFSCIVSRAEHESLLHERLTSTARLVKEVAVEMQCS